MKRGRKVFSARYGNHPLWFDALNRIWSLTYPIGTAANLDKDNLIKTARRKTGLQDLGPDFWDEPLERLIWSIEHEANLHPIGRFITRQRLINLLSVRLRAEWWFKATSRNTRTGPVPCLDDSRPAEDRHHQTAKIAFGRSGQPSIAQLGSD